MSATTPKLRINMLHTQMAKAILNFGRRIVVPHMFKAGIVLCPSAAQIGAACLRHLPKDAAMSLAQELREESYPMWALLTADVPRVADYENDFIRSLFCRYDHYIEAKSPTGYKIPGLLRVLTKEEILSLGEPADFTEELDKFIKELISHLYTKDGYIMAVPTENRVRNYLDLNNDQAYEDSWADQESDIDEDDTSSVISDDESEYLDEDDLAARLREKLWEESELLFSKSPVDTVTESTNTELELESDEWSQRSETTYVPQSDVDEIDTVVSGSFTVCHSDDGSPKAQSPRKYIGQQKLPNKWDRNKSYPQSTDNKISGKPGPPLKRAGSPFPTEEENWRARRGASLTHPSWGEYG